VTLVIRGAEVREDGEDCSGEGVDGTREMSGAALRNAAGVGVKIDVDDGQRECQTTGVSGGGGEQSVQLRDVLRCHLEIHFSHMNQSQLSLIWLAVQEQADNSKYTEDGSRKFPRNVTKFPHKLFESTPFHPVYLRPILILPYY
jgi:hypothetical protein